MIRRALPGPFAALLVASTAGAVETPEPSARKYWVDFEAGRVEVDGDLTELELADDVAIKVDRYRLSSQRLRLRRTPRGVIVDGDGHVAFCPCPDPPVSFGFRRAIVAPPTDLFVEQPTVRVGGVPVFWLPVLWLRAPDRLGLLPPRVSYRGSDGVLAGTGVHVPLGGTRGPTLSTLDLFASGYFRGGAEVETRLYTEHTSTQIRWDHLRQSLVHVDARGSALARTGAGAAWRIDAIRGERGRRGTLALEPAARNYDRGRFAVSAREGGLLGALAVASVARRGGPFDDPGTGGPGLFVGWGGALGSGASAELGLDAATLRSRELPATSYATFGGELRGDLPAGPLLLEASLAELGTTASTERGASVSAWSGGRARISLPVARGFGDAADPVVHRVEPFLDGGARFGARRAAPEAPLVDTDASVDQPLGVGLAGLRSSLGRYGRRWGLALEGRGGWAATEERARPVTTASVGGDGGALALRAEAAWHPDDVRALHAAGRARLGRVDALHVGVMAEGRLAREPVLARMLSGDATWDVPARGWLDEPGWSSGAELGIPWTRWLASHLSAERDLSRERWLALGSALGYRHPCGCLAALATVGHRLGRDGVDAALTLDLMP